MCSHYQAEKRRLTATSDSISNLLRSFCRATFSTDEVNADLPKNENLRAVQLPLGHSELETSVRDLSIDVDDAVEISEQTEI